MGLVSTDWLMAQGWQQGLFAHCIEEGALSPLPFNVQATPGCYQARDAGYIRAAAVLCVVCLLADIAATVLTGLGLRTQDHCDKNKYYRYAVFCMGGALISLLTALVIYPVFFAAELNLGNRLTWEFGWAYGVAWGAAIFLFGGAVLLLCDKESEEIYYKERKIVRDDVAMDSLVVDIFTILLNVNELVLLKLVDIRPVEGKDGLASLSAICALKAPLCIHVFKVAQSVRVLA
ncbi:hypothetical protein QAD02_016038 [Eretmocerus hayati]|uniref:Uncharacterized protein n=1 Tax=Eretmocerus hayati TaxID=131215 RepID=A0ACC2PB86_9HYME|nr:hypothetical protein QAD02_016038 [Eretmocerus hayati]